MGRTKKVGTTGRFGARYGRRTKKMVASIEKIQKQRQTCPLCERKTLKRLAAGIWFCKKCRGKIAGGAYFPESTATQVIKKALMAKGE